MAKNTGRGFRRGAVRGRSQTKTSYGYVKRGPKGQFMDGSRGPFKGVRTEK